MSQRAISAFQIRLLRWYRRCGRQFPWREQGLSSYELLVAEVLLQRTRAETVAAIFGPFLREYPDWVSLVNTRPTKLQRLLRPLGLWRRRSDSLRALARALGETQGNIPRRREDLERLPAVGQYIASAMLLAYHGRAAPLLDVNMSRVLERYFGPRRLADIRYDPYLQELAYRVVSVRGRRRRMELNWAILDHAALVCIPRQPRCHQCPVVDGCEFARLSGTLSGAAPVVRRQPE